MFSQEEVEVEEEFEIALDSSETFGGEVGVEVTNGPRPGPHYCHCMRGPLEPDADNCDLWP